MRRLISRRWDVTRAPSEVRKRGQSWEGRCHLCAWGCEAHYWKPAFWAASQHVINHHTYNLET